MTCFDKLHLRDKITPIVFYHNSANYAQYDNLLNMKRKKLCSFVSNSQLTLCLIFIFILYFILYFTLFIFLILCVCNCIYQDIILCRIETNVYRNRKSQFKDVVPFSCRTKENVNRGESWSTHYANDSEF